MSEGIRAALFIGGIFAAYGIIVGWLDRRAVRLERRRLDLESKLTPDDLPSAASTFLGTVDRSLGLPADIRAEVRAELAAHLSDSISALESEGLAQDAAAREATARLGRPEELARQLRAAHQTTRRLLAGAAGGVFWTGIGVFEGWLLSFLLFVIVAVPASLLLGLLATSLRVTIDTDALSTTTAIVCLFEAGAAFMAALRASSSIARTTRRNAVTVARIWGLSGAALITLLVLFVVPAQQSPLVPPAELAIAAAFALGAMASIRHSARRFPGGRSGLVTVAGSLVVVSIVVLFALSSSSGTSSGGSGASIDPASRGWTGVAPWYPESHPDSAPWVTGDGNGAAAPVATYRVRLDTTALSSWRGIRFEAWRAKAPSRNEGPLIVDPTYSAPFAIVPALPNPAGDCSVRFDFSHVRSTGDWLIFTTGTAPNGQRYILGFPEERHSFFSGTIWDWVTAAE